MAGLHTPAPWTFRELLGDDGFGYVEFDGNSRQVIAHAGERCWSAEQNRANGVLMAASPRLVSALIGAVNGWERWYSQLPVAAEETEFTEMFEARRAIAQALGLEDWRHAFPQYDPRAAAARRSAS